MNLNEKLHRIRYRINPGRPHIKPDPRACAECMQKACIYVCPVENYVLEDEVLVFKWEDCLECGACRVVCPSPALQWDYPDGAFGISYRYG